MVILPWMIRPLWMICENTPMAAQDALFESKAKGKPTAKTIKTLVLLLVASGIVTHKVEYKEIPGIDCESIHREHVVLAR